MDTKIKKIIGTEKSSLKQTRNLLKHDKKMDAKLKKCKMKSK